MAGCCKSDSHCRIRYLKGQKDKGTECSSSRIFIPAYPVAVDSYWKQLKRKGLTLPGLLVPGTQSFPMSTKTFIDLQMGTMRHFLSSWQKTGKCSLKCSWAGEILVCSVIAFHTRVGLSGTKFRFNLPD